jgi:gas vesicle protein
MNAYLIKTTAAVLVSGLLLSSCETPEQTGVASGLAAGALAGGVASALGANRSQAVAIGLATGAVVGATAYIIAKRRATERQRRIAEERARLAYERMSTTRKARVKKTRYIAVKTERDTQAKGAATVMVYDTQTQQVVGGNVYDVKQTPKDGQISKFDTYSAEYVGTGA